MNNWYEYKGEKAFRDMGSNSKVNRDEVVVDEVVENVVDAASVSEAIEKLEQSGVLVQSIELISPEQASLKKSRIDLTNDIRLLLSHNKQWLPALDVAMAELRHFEAHRKTKCFVDRIQNGMTAQQFLDDSEALQWLSIFVLHDGQPIIDSLRLRNRIVELSKDRLLETSQNNSLTYPVVLMLGALFLLLFNVAVVIPILSDAKVGLSLIWSVDHFHEKHALESRFAQGKVETLLGTLCLAIAAFSGFVWLWRKFSCGNRLLGVCVAGNAPNLKTMSSLIDILANLLEWKASLPLALQIAGSKCGDVYFQDATAQLSLDIQSHGTPGTTYSSASSQKVIRLPQLLLHALSISEKSGPSIALLRQISIVYNERRRSRIQWFGPALTILALLVVAIVCITVCAAIGYAFQLVGF